MMMILNDGTAAAGYEYKVIDFYRMNEMESSETNEFPWQCHHYGHVIFHEIRVGF